MKSHQRKCVTGYGLWGFIDLYHFLSFTKPLFFPGGISQPSCFYKIPYLPYHGGFSIPLELRANINLWNLQQKVTDIALSYQLVVLFGLGARVLLIELDHQWWASDGYTWPLYKLQHLLPGPQAYEQWTYEQAYEHSLHICNIGDRTVPCCLRISYHYVFSYLWKYELQWVFPLPVLSLGDLVIAMKKYQINRSTNYALTCMQGSLNFSLHHK